MGVIRTAFSSLDKDIFPLLYKAMVKPHLEYASPVWNPHLKWQVKLLEDCQRRSTKLLPGLKELAYEERVRELNFLTLVYRREKGDMIEAYKMLNGKYDISLLSLLCLNSHKHDARGHQFKLQHNINELSRRKHFFTNRIASMWNDLPDNLLQAKQIKDFEKRLGFFWMNNVEVYAGKKVRVSLQ